MAAVQFKGIPDTVDAYRKRNCPSWSLYAGKQFLFPYATDSIEDGAAVLEEYLDMLFRNGTTATYTLCVYDDKGASDRINSKTPFDSSFNFRLLDESEPRYGRQGANGEMLSRLAGIEAKLSKPVEDEQSTIGKIGEYIENNEWAQQLIGSIVTHVLKLPPGLGIPGLTPPVQNLAGVTAGSDQDAKIKEAIEQLKARDRNLGDTLLKVAKLDDATYNFLIGQLNQIQ